MIYYKKRLFKNSFRRLKNFFSNCKNSSYDKLEKNFLKKAFLCLFSIFLFIVFGFYSACLFLLPKFVSDTNIKEILNNYLSKNTKLVLDIESLNIKPDYKLGISVKADKIKLKYKDKGDFIVLFKPDIEISPLTLILGYFDLNKVKIKKAEINCNFTNTNKFDCFEYFNFDILDFKNPKLSKLRNINVLIDNTKIKIYDENIKKTFFIDANNTKLQSNSLINKDKSFNIISLGNIKTQDKNINNFKLNLELKIKEVPFDKIDKKLKGLNYNPFLYADKFDFKSKTDIDLKIVKKQEKFLINGKTALEDFQFTYNGITLPKNKFILFFKDNTISTDCAFNFFNNQFIKIKGIASFDKNNFIELKINSNEINLAQLNSLLVPVSKIFHLKIQAEKIKLEGSLIADLYIKSNFKKITSNGILKIKNAKIKDTLKNISLDNINSDINFKNNEINILNSSFELEKEKFYLNGKIDSNSFLNLKINSNKMNLAKLFSILKISPLLNFSFKDFTIKDGLTKITADITGNLKNPIFKLNSTTDNLKIYLKNYDSDLSITSVSASSYNSEFIDLKLADAKIIKHINKKNTLVHLPLANLKVSKNEINLAPAKISIDKINGVISAKYKNNILDFNLNSNVLNKNNLIVIKNPNTKFDLSASIKQNKLIFNNFKVYNQSLNFCDIKGSIDNININPTFNNLKINIDNKLSILLPEFKNSSFDVKGNILLNGNTKNPNILSNLEIKNAILPLYNLKIGDGVLNIKNSNVYFNLLNSYLFGFSADLAGNLKLEPQKTIVNNVDILINHLDLDKFLQNQTKTQPKSELHKLEIQNFTALINSISYQDISTQNTKISGSLKNGVLDMKKINLDLFKGSISADINYNLINSKIKTNMILRDINVRLLLAALDELKNASIAATGKLSGVISTEAKGTTIDEIIKTAQGYIKFSIKDGELAQFAKLERFLQAGNILSQSILKLSLNSVISTVTKQNTGDFELIEGSIILNNAIANVKYIKTQGTNMSLYMNGNYHLVNKTANLKVLGRVPLNIVNVMGNFGSFTAQKLVDKMSDTTKTVVEDITKSPIEKILSQNIDSSDLEKIPPLTNQTDRQTREFIVFIQGMLHHTSSIKNFRWNNYN